METDPGGAVYGLADLATRRLKAGSGLESVRLAMTAKERS
jgi:hypothetical protein